MLKRCLIAATLLLVAPTTYAQSPSTSQQVIPGYLTNIGCPPAQSYCFVQSNLALATVQSTATEAFHVLKASAGNLYSISVTVGATSGYLMIFNAISAPTDGAVTPAYCIPVTSNGTNGLNGASWSVNPASFSTGITAVFSSTGCTTKTASATAFFTAQVQ